MVTPAEINAFVAEGFPGSRNECVEVGPTFAVARFVVTPDNIRPGGYISGPTQFGLADATLWYAVFGAIGIEPMAVTSEMSIRFLRPAIGTTLYARADLDNSGHRSVIGTIHLWVDDRTDKYVSVAQGTYVRPG